MIHLYRSRLCKLPINNRQKIELIVHEYVLSPHIHVIKMERCILILEQLGTSHDVAENEGAKNTEPIGFFEFSEFGGGILASRCVSGLAYSCKILLACCERASGWETLRYSCRKATDCHYTVTVFGEVGDGADLGEGEGG